MLLCDDAERVSIVSMVHHVGFLNLIFFPAGALERHILHYHARFYEDRSCCRTDITIFHIFLLKCKIHSMMALNIA